MRRAALLALLATTVVLSACGGEEDDEGGGPCGGSGSTMRPGENCVACHSNVTRAGGTVYAAQDANACDGLAGVAVRITGSFPTVDRTTNSAGNFYTGTNIGSAFTVTLTHGASTASHAHTGASGACNSCHGAGNRITVP